MYCAAPSAARGRRRLQEKKMQLTGSKDGGWEYRDSAGESKMEISDYRPTGEPPEQGKLGRRHRNPSTRAAGLLHRQPVRHHGFFGMCRTTAGGRTFWRRNRHTQKRLHAWIGDACKRRLLRSRPPAWCGKQSHCEAKEKYMTRTTIGAGLIAFISCIAFGQPAAHPPTFRSEEH